uniref:Uncharacterized protein n=1 Tax=Lotharella oceanica TaxID=641309 RepID=A0A7S2XCU2_9EUKA
MSTLSGEHSHSHRFKPVDVSPSDLGCTSARTAMCLVGTRIDGKMRRFGFVENFLEHVVAPLGGPNSVDLFVNTDSQSLQSDDFKDLEKIWPDCRQRAVAFDATIRTYPKIPRRCRSLLVMGSALLWNNATHVLARRLSSCFEQVASEEARCQKSYRWVYKHRPDAYLTSDVFGEGKTLGDLEESKAYFVEARPQHGFNDISFLLPRSLAPLALNLSDSRRIPRCFDRVLLQGTCPHALQINAVYPECLLNYAMRSMWTSRQVVPHGLCYPLLARDPDALASSRERHDGNARQRCELSPAGNISYYEFCGGRCGRECRRQINVQHQRC